MTRLLTSPATAPLLALFSLLCVVGSALSFQQGNTLHISATEFTSYNNIQANADANVNDTLALFRVVRRHIPLGRAAGLMLLGMGLFIGALAVGAQHVAPSQISPLRLRPNWILLGLGLLALGTVAEANGQVLGLRALDPMNFHLQYALWCAGIIGVVLGLAGLMPDLSAESEQWPRYEWAALVGIIALGAILRLWNLGNIRVLVDELPFLSSSLRFDRQSDINLLAPMNDVFAFPWVYSYWVHGAVEVFGHSYAASRIPSALLGIAAIPALYLMARSLFDRRTALIAAALLATFPPHLHFSRLNLLHGGDALAGLVACAYWLRGMQSGRRMDFIIGGAALGLTQYFYEGGRLAFIAIWAVWLTSGVLLWRRPIPWRGIGLGLLTAIIMAIPVYYTLYGTQASGGRRFETNRLTSQHWERLAQSSPDDLIFQAQIDRTINPFLHYVSVPDLSIFYAGDTPLLLLPLIPFFFMGIAYLLYHGRDPAASLILCWLILPALGQSLLVESGISVRLTVVLPALILITAIGLRQGLGLLWQGVPLPQLWLALLVMILCFFQINYYFGDHLAAFNARFRLIKPYPDGEDSLLWAVDQQYFAGTRFILISNPAYPESYAREILFFLNEAYVVETLQPDELSDEYLNTLRDSFDHVFFIPKGDTETVERLRQYVTLQPAQFSPYSESIPDERELVMYFSPAYVLGE